MDFEETRPIISESVRRKITHIGKQGKKRIGDTSPSKVVEERHQYCYLANPDLVCPTTNDPERLFRFVVSMAIKKVCSNYHGKTNPKEYKDYMQWTSLLFDGANDINRSRMSIVTKEFRTYLEYDGPRFRWNFDKIVEDWPDLFRDSSGQKRESSYKSAGSGFSQVEVLKALDDEIQASKDASRQNSYQIKSVTRSRGVGLEGVFELTLDLDEDEDPKIFEGLPVRVVANEKSFEATVLEYNVADSIVFVKGPLQVILGTAKALLVIDATWLIVSVKRRLEWLFSIVSEENLLLKTIGKNWKPEPILEEPKQLSNRKTNLDNSQLEARRSSLTQTFTGIWGPPGTGKSTTLAEVIIDLFDAKEKTLVVSIANIAVDAIAEKFVELVLNRQKNERNYKFPKGKAIRLGFTRNRKLIEEGELYPHTVFIETIRTELAEVHEQLANKHLPFNNILVLRSRKVELQNRLKDALEAHFYSAYLFFSTASKAISDDGLEDIEFDNVLIDEASMMSIPSFLALALRAKKRIIICGDFRQLGPVALASTPSAFRYLHRDIFAFAGIQARAETFSHPALATIYVQRRFPKEVCDLINARFYYGKLQTSYSLSSNSELLASVPSLPGPISFIDLSKDARSEVIRTSKGSRTNPFSATVVCDVLKQIIEGTAQATIGIITPYRAQVREIEFEMKFRQMSNAQDHSISVGTIHSFQGSEREWIIFDLTDTTSIGAGRLFQGDSGSRLMNVAISRTKGRLVVIGDLNIFLRGRGSNSIDPAVRSLAEGIQGQSIKWRR